MRNDNINIDKKVWIAVLVMFIVFLSGCSTPKKLEKALETTEKKPIVERIKEKIEDYKSGTENGSSLALFKKKEVGAWELYNNTDPNFSFKYPMYVSINNSESDAKFKLIINSLKLETINASGTIANEDILILAKNIQNGVNDAFWGESLEDARIIGKIQDSGYREELFFDKDECNINFERKLVIFKDGYLLNLSLIAPADQIVKENPDFFKVGPKECEEKMLWKYERQSEFYLMLKENRLSGVVQEWYNLFDLIKKSINTSEIEQSEKLVSFKTIYLNENNALKWIELSSEKQKLLNIKENLDMLAREITLKALKDSDYFVNYYKNGIISLSFAGQQLNGEKFLVYRNYNTINDQVLSISDLIKEERKDDLVVLAGVRLKENIEKYNIKNLADKSFSREDLESFILTNEGIRFNIGQASANDKFVPELYVVFSYEELKDFLKNQI